MAGRSREESGRPAPDDRPELSSALVDLRDKPPEPLAVAPAALGVWELAWPTIVSFGAYTLVRAVDFAMVGSLGPDALAAVGLGGQIYWLVQSIAMLVPTGLTAILSRAVGASDPDLADRALRQSLLLATAIALLTTLCGLPFSRESIQIYGVEPSVVGLGADYVWWLLLGTVPFAHGMVFGTAIRAAGDARTPLYIGIVVNLVNLVLNWVLIFGKLGFPALGVAGAAIASSLAMVVQAVVFFWLWGRGHLILPPRGGSWRFDRALARRISVIGYPASTEQGLFQIGLLAFQRILSPYGTAVIAAYNVGVQVLSFSFIPGVGFATAAATLVGQRLGARDSRAAERSGWRATWGALVTQTATGVVIVAFAEPLARVFSDDAAVVALTVDFIWILGALQPLMAFEFALGGALRGAGDTVFPMQVLFVALFVVRLVPAALLAWVFDASVQWVWCALVGDYALRALLFVWRFRKGHWKTLEV